MNYGFTITTAGRALLAKLLAGERLEVSRAMVGSGQVEEGKNPIDFTDLVSPVVQGTSTVPLVQEDAVSFVVEYRSDLNGGLDQGFWLREFGVFAMDPGAGEILLYYATLGDYPQYVSAYKKGSVDVRRYPVSIRLSTEDVDVATGFDANAFMTSQGIVEYTETTTIPLVMERVHTAIGEHNTAENTHLDVRNETSTLGARVGRLEDMMLNDVSGNPYLVDFADLTGLTVEGVHNTHQARMEF